METSPAIIVIGNTPFIIDREKSQLIQFNKSPNKIPFASMKNEGEYYSMYFDNERNRAAPTPLDQNGPPDYLIKVTIPLPVLNLPDTLQDAYKLALNYTSLHEKWGFFIGDEKTARRLSGMLPHIDLAGTDFTIDWRLKQLRETEQPWKNIDMTDMDISESGNEYMFFYNTETHEAFQPDRYLTELPANVVVLEIPNEIALDPVAVARQYGLRDTNLLISHPIQAKLSAAVKPLSGSGLPEYVKNNLKRLSNPPNKDENAGRRNRR